MGSRENFPLLIHRICAQKIDKRGLNTEHFLMKATSFCMETIWRQGQA